MEKMPSSGTTIPEIIRLQLRKPKSWHWELSTSKSSPHIILPVIQLYDYKGQLLVETADNEDTSRTICRSNEAARRRTSDEKSSHLTRSRQFGVIRKQRG
ncbi:uncharacterized protein [Leptinotarsa decemlineata]|uniref:uncharacterized protein n=1 Tax=Leptinotarsa decemlineata TaxID=7539 RepID=UPI003D3076DA